MLSEATSRSGVVGRLSIRRDVTVFAKRMFFVISGEMPFTLTDKSSTSKLVGFVAKCISCMIKFHNVFRKYGQFLPKFD